MSVPAIPLLAALAPLVPAVARLFHRDGLAKVADVVADTAVALTGQTDQAGIVAALQADPGLAAKMATAAMEVELGLERERYRQLEITNATMQAEAKSNDPFVRRMRPTFGYVMAAAWLWSFGTIGYMTLTQPDRAPALMSALSDTWWLWTVGLSVLGIYVAARSQEKSTSLLDALPFPIRGRNPRR